MYECGCFQVPCKGEGQSPQLLDMARETCPWGSTSFPVLRMVSIKHPGELAVLHSPSALSTGLSPTFLPGLCPFMEAPVRVMKTASGHIISVGTERGKGQQYNPRLLNLSSQLFSRDLIEVQIQPTNLLTTKISLSASEHAVLLSAGCCSFVAGGNPTISLFELRAVWIQHSLS